MKGATAARTHSRPRHITCPECDGEGYIDCSAPDTYQHADIRVGGFPAQRCRTCDGEGTVERVETGDGECCLVLADGGSL